MCPLTYAARCPCALIPRIYVVLTRPPSGTLWADAYAVSSLRYGGPRYPARVLFEARASLLIQDVPARRGPAAVCDPVGTARLRRNRRWSDGYGGRSAARRHRRHTPHSRQQFGRFQPIRRHVIGSSAVLPAVASPLIQAHTTSDISAYPYRQESHASGSRSARGKGRSVHGAPCTTKKLHENLVKPYQH